MGTRDLYVIYLGEAAKGAGVSPTTGLAEWDIFAEDDPTAQVVENAKSFIGYDSSKFFGNALWKQAGTATITSNNPYDGKTYEDSAAEIYNDPSIKPGTITWDGETTTLDAIEAVNVTFTFTDGSEYTDEVIFMQTVDDKTFLTSYDGSSVNYTKLPIASMRVNTVEGSPDFVLEYDFNDRPFAVPCFTRNVRIKTEDGVKNVEDLIVGDRVYTKDNGLKDIKWIASRPIDRQSLIDNPNLRPIRIRKGALGCNLPEADLIVSRQHRVLVRSKIAQRVYGTNEILVPAKDLLMLEGVEVVADLEPVEYFHFIFDQHEVVYANGAETESLYPGPEAVKMIGSAAMEELLLLFPQLNEWNGQPSPARLLARGAKARNVISRHLKNGVPVFSA
ncbi:Hint domain-containing protein [Paracoccus onubensis]|uniref:Hedgehog/Intein (Hint) domain-containing protein n=1 Tax=Paracoccus onubensis TaxID=1675788 RepID=A0A418SNU1_9RHOB|nr:Hint domain-containing protein [Paracoccus onubensis]RJE82547.1 hypothetical protein D3P04_19455 [Paracoccus onubensis]